jgi:lysophospholipase L1-like esterase
MKLYLASALILMISSSVCGQVQAPASAGVGSVAPRPDAATDWAQLSRYREANAALGDRKDGDIRVVFLGDSITEMWPTYAQAFFPGRGYIGRGIGGQTTPQLLVRFQQDVVNLRPDVVVINAGTNDIAGNTGPASLEMIEDNLKSMTQIAVSNKIRVVLASVTPARDYPWRPGMEPAEKIVALNSWIAGWCARNQCIYADYFSALADGDHGMKAGLSSDGVHPNESGYFIMQPIAARAIGQAIAARWH